MNHKLTAHRHTDSSTNSLLFTIFGLVIFGIVMVYDATVVVSQNAFGGAYRFVLLQIGWVALGTLGFLFFYKYDYRKLYKLAYPLFGLTLVFLFTLAFMGILPCNDSFVFAPCLNGANRWLYINPAPFPRLPILGVLGFQPSELAKLALILYLAFQLNKRKDDRKAPFYVYLVATGIVSLLVLLQPNMSTAVLIFIIASVMYFCTDFTLKPFFITIPTLGLLGAIFAVISPYRRERLFTFLHLNPGETQDLSIGYHIKQILIALGSGGMFGVGFGQSRQKFQYLPETSADSIFAIIGEELGFIGTTIVVLLFCFLIYKGFTIAKNAPDLVGRLLATGITTWIGVQFFINIAAMTKIIPLTGVPIPLISYGGSSMFFSLMALGILANIGKSS